MKFFLLLLSAACFGLAAMLVLRIADVGGRVNWMSEVEILALLLLAAMFLCACAIVGAVDRLRPEAPAHPLETERERQVRQVAATLIPAPPAS